MGSLSPVSRLSNRFRPVANNPRGGRGENGELIKGALCAKLLNCSYKEIADDDPQKEHIAIAARGGNKHRKHDIEHIVKGEQVGKPNLPNAFGGVFRRNVGFALCRKAARLLC